VIRDKINIDVEKYRMENAKEISPRMLSDFKILIEDMRRNAVRVEFFMAPYAPVVYNVIKNQYELALKTEVFINTYAKENSIKVYGSFDPSNMRLNESFFYDGIHCKEKAIHMILLE
jgi:hypothetical protein